MTFQYDGYGRRTLNAAGNKLLYQGSDVTQELSGATPLANRVVGGVDDFFARSDAGGAYSPLADVLGSVLGLVDSSGNLATQYTYDPFGNTTAAGSVSSNTFQCTGRENDNNGLYYYRARYYSPQYGRFMSEDPIGFGGGMNLYSYVSDSPVGGTDAWGLWSTDAHNQIIWNALHPCGVSNHDIWQIQQGSHWVDKNFQDPAHSYTHSMSDGTTNQSASVARNLRDQYVATSMTVASRAMQAGQSDQGLFDFGAAIHPLMDMTSPAHTNYDTGNPIPWCGMFTGCSHTFDHGGDSDGHNPWSIENVAALNKNPRAQELENVLIRTWYHALTGRGCNCSH